MSYNFVNPYNFIPLSSSKPKRDNEKGQKWYSGVIEYSLLTKTPLIIPNTSNNNAFKSNVDGHHSYDFFSYTDISSQDNAKGHFYEPVIPGSEIRGMIRSNFEILTNSCLSALESDEIMSKRICEPFTAGLLKKVKTKNDKGEEITTYDLVKAEDCIFRADMPNSLNDASYSGNYKDNVKSFIQKDLTEGQKIKFDKVVRKGKPLANSLNNGSITGYVIKGNAGLKKHNMHIFVPTSEVVETQVHLSILKQVLKMYDKNQDHKKRYTEYSKSLKNYESSKDALYFPVYYSVINEGGYKAVFLSPASITREAYEKTLGDLVGAHNTCSDKNNLCPACKLFGTVIQTESGNASVASRVRFSDMEFEGVVSERTFENEITLAPLSSPKLNNMEFYLKRPQNAVFWNYDYYIDNNGKIHKNEAGINGRKFYWHDLEANYVSTEATKLNATMRPLKAGNEFKGKVYFDNLSKQELDTLVYTINCGSEACSVSEKKHGYKIGHAKPLGYGSVALSVDNVLLRSVVKDINTQTIKFVTDNYQFDEPEIEAETQKNFAKMTDFYATKGRTVSYPKEKSNGLIYEWFVTNHGGVSMRNKRVQEGYAEYMIPLEINLGKTGAHNGSGNKKQRHKYELNHEYAGAVTGHDEKTGQYAYVQLEDGGRASFKDNGKCKKGDKVTVIYRGEKKGKNGNKYPSWDKK